VRKTSLILTAMALLALAGCGSSPSATPGPQQMFQSYINSTNVKNDEFGGVSDNADRIANIASQFSRDQLTSYLFGAYQCDEVPSTRFGCPPDAAVTATAHRFGGSLAERDVLVKHQDGQLEIAALYVATKGRASELIDATGRSYPGGLADFRAHNTVLGPADLMLFGSPIDHADGRFRLQVATGHTPPSHAWAYLLLGVLIVLAAVLVVVPIVIRRRRRPTPTVTSHYSP
jgi:starvation-inducible outer membrane lipoprotein